jgi:hypothetical protein
MQIVPSENPAGSDETLNAMPAMPPGSPASVSSATATAPIQVSGVRLRDVRRDSKRRSNSQVRNVAIIMMSGAVQTTSHQSARGERGLVLRR